MCSKGSWTWLNILPFLGQGTQNEVFCDYAFSPFGPCETLPWNMTTPDLSKNIEPRVYWLSSVVEIGIY